jgi:hypothetical protein
MKDTITKFQFVEEMAQDKHGFSYEGATALFNYFEQYENECATEIEFDPIAFRCEYSEYDNFKEIQNDYNDLKDLEDLYDHTQVIEIPNSEKIIIQQY